jgi:hypothetical protein
MDPYSVVLMCNPEYSVEKPQPLEIKNMATEFRKL